MSAGVQRQYTGTEGEGISYVMAVPCSETFATPAGKMRADALTALVPAASPPGTAPASGNASAERGKRDRGLWTAIPAAQDRHPQLPSVTKTAPSSSR